MEIEEALKAILLDLDGYFGVEDVNEHFTKDLRRYLTQVYAAGYRQGAFDLAEAGA